MKKNEKYSQNVLNILTAFKCKGIGEKTIRKLYTRPFSCDEWRTIVLDFAQKYSVKFDFDIEMEKIAEILDGQSDINYTALYDEDFPICRTSTALKEFPVFLAYQGNLKLLLPNSFNIAVIGLLEPSSEIIEMERAIVAGILESDAVIVSGLALGCDSIAHECVSEIHRTIAVLPSPLHDILPKKNKELAKDILINKNGLLLSEYYEDAKDHYEQNARYIERDRLQAIFSDMVVLTASYSEKDSKNDKKKDSGSRHAMNKAKEYGIKRAVMYEEAYFNDEKFNLNRELMHTNGITNFNVNAIESFNKTSQSRDFKVLTRTNTSYIIKRLKEWKEKSQISVQKPKTMEQSIMDFGD